MPLSIPEYTVLVPQIVKEPPVYVKTKSEKFELDTSDKKIGYYVKGEVGAELLPEIDKALDF